MKLRFKINKEIIKFIKKTSEIIIKSCYLNYEFITRYFMQVGTDPETYYQFFCGLYIQFNDNPITKYIIFLIIFLIIILLKIIFKIKLIYKNISKIVKYTLLSLIVIYLIIVFFYWIRYKIFGIK